MTSGQHYVISGGKAGYERLQVLSRDRWPDTLALFRRAGIRPGMRCLDLGCGGGAVTVEIGKLVGPGGSVVGVDMDEVKLELARGDAMRLGLSNVEFRSMNVDDWNEPNSYDFVYSRFLLHHLHRPVELLRRMRASARTGGRVVLEDADFSGWCCEPTSPAFDFFVRTYSEAVRRNGGDPEVGRKLYRYFHEAGIPNPELTLVQPVRTEGEAKGMPLSTLEMSAEAILSAGLATKTELDSALADLARFTADSRTLISGPRVFQAWSSL